MFDLPRYRAIAIGLLTEFTRDDCGYSWMALHAWPSHDACYPREGGRSMTWPQFRRWCLTRVPVRETRDLVRRRYRLGWRP